MNTKYELLKHFIEQREMARHNKKNGWPYGATDPIVQNYRFCNIDRENDRVTKWIDEHIRKAHTLDAHQWFLLIAARLFNEPSTLTTILRLWDGEWRSKIIRKVLHNTNMHTRTFNPAYIVSTNGISMDKIDYVCELVLQPIWEQRFNLGFDVYSCANWFDWLVQFNGIGDFLANQIVTDLRRTKYLPVHKTEDWSTFVMAGPGTKRGLNRLHNRPVKQSLSPKVAVPELLTLQMWLHIHVPHLTQTWQDPNNVANLMCEFDKYCRAHYGEGRPKQKYRPASE